MRSSRVRRLASDVLGLATRTSGGLQASVPIPRQKILSCGGLELRPITGSLGAEVFGAKLKGSLSEGEVEDVRRAFMDHSVLVFRNQGALSGEDMLRIARIFGEPEERPVVKAQYGLPQVHELVREPNTAGRYGEVWHHDCSYMRDPPLGAMLYGVEVPPYGNDTVFACMYGALDSLSPQLVKILEQLKAVHSAFKMVQKDPEGEYLDYDEVEHPVIRTHPETGRPALFVNAFFVKRFVGMSEEESRGLLEHLFSLAKRAELQCRVRWEPETLVVWDNRCSQHMAIRDNTEHRRVMRRVEIKGDTPF